MTDAATTKRPDLKIAALDPEDLAILSAHLQDAEVKIGDMAYLPKAQRFALVASRFDWFGAGQGICERCQTGLHFERGLARAPGWLRPGPRHRPDAPCHIVHADRAPRRHRHAALLGRWGHQARCRVPRSRSGRYRTTLALQQSAEAGRGRGSAAERQSTDRRFGLRPWPRRSKHRGMQTVMRLDVRSSDFEHGFTRLLAAKREVSEDVDVAVAGIIADVDARGDDALIDLSARFDRVDLGALGLRITADDIAAAAREVPADTLAALTLARDRIVAFHARQKPADQVWTDGLGIELGWRWSAIAAVGLYVPGGTASYPSSVLMNAGPGQGGGLRARRRGGADPGRPIEPLVLAAAHLAGVDEIYRVGGAQAIAALAYGTATIAAVSKIVGPGNAFVAAAKRRVFGRVGIDMIAGPSEIVILADSSAPADYVASDLLAQAEHDPVAQSILVTDDPHLADAVVEAVERQLATLPRRDIAGASWRDYGAVILVPSLAAAVPLIDRLAPEHLEIMARDGDELARPCPQCRRDLHRGRYAGGDRRLRGGLEPCPADRAFRSLRLGPRGARFHETDVGAEMQPAGLAGLGPAAIALGRAEGLDAHARSVALRMTNG